MRQKSVKQSTTPFMHDSSSNNGKIICIFLLKKPLNDTHRGETKEEKNYQLPFPVRVIVKTTAA